jgi:hypothetical protein
VETEHQTGVLPEQQKAKATYHAGKLNIRGSWDDAEETTSQEEEAEQTPKQKQVKATYHAWKRNISSGKKSEQ